MRKLCDMPGEYRAAGKQSLKVELAVCVCVCGGGFVGGSAWLRAQVMGDAPK